MALGAAETIQVHQISTSDPQFFLGMNPLTIASIGGAIAWALNTWKQVEEIRKIRADTRKSSVFTEKEVEDFFDKKIKSTITAAIEAQAKALLAQISTESGRVYEQAEHVKRALESILARVERGMTVEIRALPPAAGKEASDEQPAQTVAFERLKTITPNLVFPKPEPNPILSLPEPDRKKKELT